MKLPEQCCARSCTSVLLWEL